MKSNTEDFLVAIIIAVIGIISLAAFTDVFKEKPNNISKSEVITMKSYSKTPESENIIVMQPITFKQHQFFIVKLKSLGNNNQLFDCFIHDPNCAECDANLQRAIRRQLATLR